MEDSDYRGVRAVDGADDASFGAAVGANVRNVGKDHVSVHRRTDLVRRDEDVSGKFRFQLTERFGIGNDEAEAVAVHGEASGDEVLVGGCLWELEAVGVDRDELAALDQLLQMVVEFAALFAVQSEFTDELLVSGLALGLAGDVLEDGGVGEHELLMTSAYPTCLRRSGLKPDLF